MKLSEYAYSRNNNYNLIRFIAASAVILSHAYPITLGRGGEDFLYQLIGISLGTLAVDIFFVTSGFLITLSLMRSTSLLKFCIARLLRIYPALIVNVFVTVFIIGGIVTSQSLAEYFSNANTWIHFVKNSTVIFGGAAYLPGVFGELPFNNAVNGSLWTLLWELRMYGLLFGLALLVRKVVSVNPRTLLNTMIVIVAVLSIMTSVYCHLNKVVFERKSIEIAIRFASLFFTGASYYVLKNT